MESLKIVQVVHSFPPHNIAGTEVYTRNLSCALSRKHKVFVFHRINDKEQDEFVVTSRQEHGLQIHTINNTFRRCDSFEMTYDNPLITKAFEKILDEVRPDVIHIQHLLFLSVGMIDVAKARGIPVVFTPHDYWMICPLGQFLKNNTEICERHTVFDCMKCMKYHLNLRKDVMAVYWSLRTFLPDTLVQIVKNAYLALARVFLAGKREQHHQIEQRRERLLRAARQVDLFLAPSQFMRQMLVGNGIPEEQVQALPLGFDVSRPTSAKKKSENGAVRFIFIGTLLPSKGVHVLIDAFNGIHEQNAELRIYGREAVYKGLEYYLKKVKEMPRNPHIHFMGGFNNEDVGEIFSQADVLVVPSIWYENFPLVIQEAFLSKTPVIASRMGGIPELIEDGVNGLLFDAGDSGQLKEKLRFAIKEPGFLQKAAQKMPIVKTMEEHVADIESIYRRLLE
jgi:glycosyltransferase involved in cell wall biosynthesis